MSGTGTSRRQLLARAGALGAAGALGGAGGLGFLGAGEAHARARPPAPDEAEVLAGLAEVEQLIVYSYRMALAAGRLSGPGRELARQVLGYEREHLRALAAQLTARRQPVPAAPSGPRAAQAALARHHSHIDFTRPRSARGWLGLLLDVEDLVERNYHLALGYLHTPALLSLAARIYASEGQHSVLLGMMLHPGKPKLAIDPFVNGQ